MSDIYALMPPAVGKAQRAHNKARLAHLQATSAARQFRMAQIINPKFQSRKTA